MPLYVYPIILAGIAVWFYPFVGAHNATPPAATVNRRSRWGVLLQFIAFTLLWQGRFWIRPRLAWRVLVCVALFALAALLSWSSSRALAGQLRIDAALGADHTLVRSGPYALVRHPIYAGYLLTHAAFLVAHPTPWNLAVLLVADTALVVRALIEERMLGTDVKYQSYCRRVGWHLVPGVF